MRFQTDLAACGLELDRALDLIGAAAVALAGADGAVIELAPGRPPLPTSCDDTDSIQGSDAPGFECLDPSPPPIVRSADALTDLRLGADLRRRFGECSLLRVSLLHADRSIGFLNLLAAGRDRFDDRAEWALAQVAGSIAAHIANANHFALEAHGSRHDGLTGLLNRRAYEERLSAEIARARRYARPLSLCLLDLDDFKALNDSLGHPAGDDVLRQVAVAIRRNRLADRGFRVGGDEFAILMPETTAAAAVPVVERVIGSLDVDASTVGMSFGIVDRPLEATAMHAVADRALLAAKDRVHQRPVGRSAPAPAS